MRRSTGTENVVRKWRRRFWILRNLQPVARGWAMRRYLERAEERSARLARAHLEGTGRLVFICHGNIMRSAFAARVAEEHFPALAARVASGGTHAKAGRPAQDAALAVAAQMQLPLTQHRATPLAALTLGEHDVIVCMDVMNEANVLAEFPALHGRVFRVGDIDAGDATVRLADRELHDPYGRGEQVTRSAFELLQRLVDAWMSNVFRVDRADRL